VVLFQAIYVDNSSTSIGRFDGGPEYTHDLIVEREGVFKRMRRSHKNGQDRRLSGRYEYYGL